MAINAQIQKRSKGFDRLAFLYDFLVKLVFGNALDHIQGQLLQCINSNTGRILIVGGGTGKILGKINGLSGAFSLVYCEVSQKMMLRSQKKFQQINKAAIKQCDFVASLEVLILDNQKFDYIILPFVLDCMSEDELVLFFDELQALKKPTSRILVADFSHSKQRSLRFFHQCFIGIMYLFFYPFTGFMRWTVPNWEQLFLKNKYAILHAISQKNGLLKVYCLVGEKFSE